MAELNDPRLPARFWRKVQPCATSGCWLWTGFVNAGGYGQFAVADAPGRWRHVYAHRAAYEALVTAIDAGLQIDHLCRVRGCVNPAHLEAVTQRENLLRGDGISAELARRTHCKRGHELTADNVYAKAGFRRCRTCVSENNRRAYQERTR